jgi:hypothetical protein
MAAYLVVGLALVAECLTFVIGLDAALTVGNAVLALVAAWAVILSGDDCDGSRPRPLGPAERRSIAPG